MIARLAISLLATGAGALLIVGLHWMGVLPRSDRLERDGARRWWL